MTFVLILVYFSSCQYRSISVINLDMGKFSELRIYQKLFEENSYISIFNYIVLYLIPIMAIDTPSKHPLYSPYIYISLSLILIVRIILILLDYSNKTIIQLSSLMLILSGLIFPIAYYLELNAGIENNNLLIVLPLWLIGVTSAASMGLYKRRKVLLIYQIEMLLLPLIFLILSPDEPNRIIFGLALIFMFLYLSYYSKKNYIIYNQLIKEKKLNESYTQEIILNKQNIEKANKELKLALSRANEATKAKSEFLANMSHEIRTPMNGIIGVVELLQDKEENPDKLNMLKIIEDSSSTLLNLINDILDFSKIEAGKFIINSETIHLSKLLESIIDRFAIKAFDKKIELMIFVEKDVPAFVVGDEHRLSQIIVNLLSNSVKFTEEGQVLLHVSLLEDKEQKVEIKFSIEDTGIGIADDKLNKIFESFIQEDESTSRRFGGTGLGTTISKRLTELMDGEMCVKSPNPNNTVNKNRGTVFSFRIPFRKAENENQVAKLDDLPVLGILKVISLDDNLTNLTIIDHSLKNWGIESYCTQNHEDARDYIEKENPDLLISDFSMPDLNGLEFITKMRALYPNHKFKTILASSDTVNTNQQIAQDYGIDVLLYKPLKQSDLFNGIQRALSGKLIKSHSKARQEVKVIEGSDKYQILLVEDNLINQKVAYKLFQSLGFEIEIAENGKIALEYVLNKNYDLIFMDYQMPVLNGIEATKILRSWKYEVPIIALTANAMKGDREKFIEAGMNDYLSKPFKRSELQQLINQYLKKD